MGPYRDADLVRLDFRIHGETVDALSRVLHRSAAVIVAKDVCAKIVQKVGRQSFEVRCALPVFLGSGCYPLFLAASAAW